MNEQAWLELLLGGRPEACSSRVAGGTGRGVWTIITAVPGSALTVTSVYVGAAGISTSVVELVEDPSGATRRVREVDRAMLPVTVQRGACLLDHAECVLRALPAGSRVEPAPGALERLEGALV